MSSVLAVLAVWSGVALGGCETPTTNDEVVVALEQAITAYEALDVAGFRGATTRVEAATDCLGESITRSTAAEFHRVRGLAAFVDREEEECRKRFAAARSIEPAYTFPVSLVPEGNPVLEHYTAMDPNAGAKVTLPFPKDGSVRLDGSARLERNNALPVIFQRIDNEGAVIETVIVASGAPVPEYPEGRAPAPTGPTASRNRTTKRVLLAAGAGSLLAAGGVYGAALGTRSAFDKERQSDTIESERINRLYSTNHALVLSSAGLAAVGVGLGTTSFVLTGQF